MYRNALERNVQALAHDKELALTTGEKIAEQLRHLEHHGAEREREYQRVCAALHEAQVQLAVERVSSSQEAKATELSHGRQTQERAIAEAAQLVRASNMSKANSAGGQDAPRDMGREDALAVTRRLLDLERGTGKLLRERNNDLETRARNVQVELDEFVQQMQVLKRQLSLKDAQIAELKTITVSWMGTGGGDSATRTQGLSATTPAATRSVTDGETDKSKSSEILQRIYRGTKVRVSVSRVSSLPALTLLQYTFFLSLSVHVNMNGRCCMRAYMPSRVHTLASTRARALLRARTPLTRALTMERLTQHQLGVGPGSMLSFSLCACKSAWSLLHARVHYTPPAGRGTSKHHTILPQGGRERECIAPICSATHLPGHLAAALTCPVSPLD